MPLPLNHPPADPSHLAFRTDSLPTVSSSSSRPDPALALVEFPADDPAWARRFWEGLLDVPHEPRRTQEGEGWQTREGGVGSDCTSAAPAQATACRYLTSPSPTTWRPPSTAFARWAAR